MNDDVLATALSGLSQRVEPPRSAAQRVADGLREQIVDGTLRCGTRLTEETISSAVGVSRNTIREAFVLLMNDRLVQREANRGVFVATPDAAGVRDLYSTRRLIEPAALEHGAAFDHELVARLRAVVVSAHRAREVNDVAAVAQANGLFHSTVMEASDSARLRALMAGLLAEMRLVFQLLDDDPTFHLPYVDRHDAIVALLKSGDRPAAARALDTYLADAAEDLLARPAFR